MDDVMDRINEALFKRSVECERGVIAVSPDGRAGFAQVGPNHMLWSWIPLPVPGIPVFDLYLN